MIIYNNVIPVKGFSAMNLFGLIFARKKFNPLPEFIINHELIHTKLILELGFILFYLIYVVEWIIRLCLYGKERAYYEISFEKEAYANEKKLDYLKERKCYALWR